MMYALAKLAKKLNCKEFNLGSLAPEFFNGALGMRTKKKDGWDVTQFKGKEISDFINRMKTTCKP